MSVDLIDYEDEQGWYKVMIHYHKGKVVSSEIYNRKTDRWEDWEGSEDA